MNKYDRLEEITKLVNQKGTVRTNEIVEELNVSDMTVRRDLAELEEKGLLTKIHGGARSNSAFQIKEKSHQEKHTENIDEKRAVARKAVNLIEENDTIFCKKAVLTVETRPAETVLNPPMLDLRRVRMGISAASGTRMMSRRRANTSATTAAAAKTIPVHLRKRATCGGLPLMNRWISNSTPHRSAKPPIR